MTRVAGWRTVQFACNTAMGVQSVTTDLDGYTPKAVILEVIRGTVAGTNANHATLGLGISDGTTHRTFSARAEDNVTFSTDTGGRAWDGGIMEYVNAANNNAHSVADFDGFITDGMEIDWTNSNGSAWLANATFFYGDDLEADVSQLTSSASISGTVSKTGLSFAPNMLYGWSAERGYPSTASGHNHWRYTQGAAADNEGTIEQWGLSTQQRDNLFTGAGGRILRADSIMQDISLSGTGTPTFNQRVAVDSFDAAGYTLRTDGVAAAMTGIYLALYVGSNRRTAKTLDLETSVSGTGANKKFTTTSGGNDWEPQCAHLLGTDVPV